MHSKSVNKIIEQLDKLSEKEVFRAYLMALKQANFNLAVKILREVEPEKRAKIERGFTLYELKTLALNGLLVAKASLAVSYYNAFAAKQLGFSSLSEQNNQFVEKKTKEKEMWEERIKEINKESGDALDLDEFREMRVLSKVFEFWKFFEDQSTFDEFVRNRNESV